MWVISVVNRLRGSGACLGKLPGMLLGMLLGVSVTASPVLTAQTTPVNPANDSAAIAAAAAQADTGRMIAGYQDLSRYNTPGYCLGAMDGRQSAIWRSINDTKRVAGQASDTLPTDVIATGRACLAGLKLDAIPAYELYNLMRLAVRFGDTTMVWSAIRRQLALATTDEERGYALSDAVEATLSAHPIQHTLAMSLLGRLDDIGVGAHVPRLLAHAKMREYAYFIRFDTAAIMREGKLMAQIETLFSPEERRWWRNELGSVFEDSISLAWYQHDPNLTANVRGYFERRVAAVPEWGLNEDQQGLFIARLAQLTESIGQTVQPLEGDFWFPDTVKQPQPPAGRVTLMFMVEKSNGAETDQIAMLRRLYTKYHAKGLDILLISKTQGYSWSSPPQEPADEAKTIAWYYRDYLKLPFTVMVAETPFTRRPDGRRMDGIIPFRTRYPTPQIMVGRDRRIYTLYKGMGFEAEIEAYLEQALAKSSDVGRN